MRSNNRQLYHVTNKRWGRTLSLGDSGSGSDALREAPPPEAPPLVLLSTGATRAARTPRLEIVLMPPPVRTCVNIAERWRDQNGLG